MGKCLLLVMCVILCVSFCATICLYCSKGTLTMSWSWPAAGRTHFVWLRWCSRKATSPEPFTVKPGFFGGSKKDLRSAMSLVFRRAKSLERVASSTLRTTTPRQ